MSVGKWIGDLIGGSGKEIITGLADTADRFIQTKEEKDAFQIEVKKYELDLMKLQMDAEQKYSKDRQSAREMYMNDSSLQKIFAIVFLSGYLIITTAMVVTVFGWFDIGIGQDMNTVQSSLITMVFTSMSNKVNTITDFLFGGSKNSTDKNITNALEKD